VQNTAILQFTQGFSDGAPAHLYIALARDGPRDLSDRAQRMEAKGFLLKRATEQTIAFVYKRSFICDT
jgi:hypothetical protein